MMINRWKVEDLGPESEEDEQEQRNPLDPGDLASQITVRRPRSTLAPMIPLQEESDLEDSDAPETTGRRRIYKRPSNRGFDLRMPSFTKTSP